ncbi:MAG: 23S rRNA (uracil(1939)-C(5))-methyltransferase RlmD [Acholeplasmataceae bacterium]|nr:23S rRNA (uracil(1939)-C(5))-methyltransferase RlmD [Acholeplasmataceae bacterium]
MKETCVNMIDMDLCKTDLGRLVKGMLKGDVISGQKMIERVKESDLIVKSKDRITPICPVYETCGGCDALHMSYQAQLDFKNQMVRERFDDIIKDGLIKPIINSESPLNYRHKTVLSAASDGRKLVLGLYAKNSKTIIPYLDCHLHNKEANDVYKTVQRLLNTYKIGAYDTDRHQGIIKHVMIRRSFALGEMLVVFSTNGGLFPNGKTIAKALIKAHPMIKGVIQNIHLKKTALVLLEEERLLAGRPTIHDMIDDITFRISSRSFYQVNPIQMRHLYHEAIKAASITKEDFVVDAYSGIGTLSLLASKHAKQVIGIESNRDADKDAVANMRLNNINNVRFINKDVNQALLEIKEPIDVLLMDPTREGADIRFLEDVLKVRPKRIVYVSCDPTTQARDIRRLLNTYDLMSLQPVDMFSQTRHVETITLLSSE